MKIQDKQYHIHIQGYIKTQVCIYIHLSAYSIPRQQTEKMSSNQQLTTDGVRRRRSGAPSPAFRMNGRSPTISQKTATSTPRNNRPTISQKTSSSSSTRNRSGMRLSRRNSPSSASTQSISQVRISQSDTPTSTNNTMFSRANLERLNEEVDIDDENVHMLLNKVNTSSWIGFYESTTGRAVYVNELTDEHTWEKPINVKIKWVDEDSFNGENCPNFDPEHLGQDYLDTPWIKPNFEAAIHFHNRSIALNGQGNFFTPIVDMDDLGSGVQSYLYFVRSMAISFWILSILVIPIIATNISGNRISPLHMDYFWMLKTTSVNAGDKMLRKCDSGNPLMNRKKCIADLQTLNIKGDYLFQAGASLSIQEYTNIISSSDLIISGLFCLMLLYTYFEMERFLKQIHEGTVDITDFAVQVWGLPPDALEDEIIDHFSNLYNLQHVDWRGRLPPNPMLYPVGHYGNTCNEYYYKKWVAEVSIVHPVGATIRKLRERVGIIDELRIARAQAKVFSTKASSGKYYQKADKKVQMLEWKLMKLFGERKTIMRHNFKHLDDTVCAFVIFNNIESYNRCLEDYNSSQNSLYGQFFQNKELKFMNDYPLRVFPAPDPSDVLYENLEVSDYYVWERKVLAFAFTIAVLVVSTLCIMILVIYQDAAIGDYEEMIDGTNEFCRSGIASSYFASEIRSNTNLTSSNGENYGKPLLASYNVEWIGRSKQSDERRARDAACGVGYRYLELKLNPLDYSDSSGKLSSISMNMSHCPAHLHDVPPLQNGKIENCINLETSKHCPCILTDTDEINRLPVCKTIPCTLDPDNNKTMNLPGCSKSYRATDIINCYCMSRIALYLENNPTMSQVNMFTAESLNDPLCNEVKNEYLVASLNSNFIGLIITTFNEVLVSVISILIEWEHTHTISEVASSICERIALFNVINIGFLPILLTWDTFSIIGNNSILSTIVGISTQDQYIGFIPRWYSNIGFSILHAMLIDSIFSYILLGLNISYKFLKSYMRLTCRKNAYTQKELNTLLDTEEFDVGSNLGYVKTTIAMTLLYSSTMPILIPVCAFNLTVYYAIEKSLLLYYNKKGPKIKVAVVTDSMKSFSFVMIARLVITIFLLGESTVFHSTTINVESQENFYYDNGIFNLFVGCCLQEHLSYHVIALILLIVVTFIMYTPDQYLPICCRNRCHHRHNRHWKRLPSYSYIYEHVDFIDKRNIAVICCCCCCKKRKPIPDNGSIFDEEKLLSEDERKNGWYVESIDRHKMSYVKRKRYMRDKMDESDGMKHKKGEIFRTWEILRETGLHSYQLAQNPKYKGMIQGKMIQKTLSRKR